MAAVLVGLREHCWAGLLVALTAEQTAAWKAWRSVAQMVEL